MRKQIESLEDHADLSPDPTYLYFAHPDTAASLSTPKSFAVNIDPSGLNLLEGHQDAEDSRLSGTAWAENVRVLGVDQTSDDASDKPVVAKAVTVEVTPEQAQQLSPEAVQQLVAHAEQANPFGDRLDQQFLRAAHDTGEDAGRSGVNGRSGEGR